MIQPRDGAEHLFVNQLAATRVRAILADRAGHPYAYLDDAFRDTVKRVGRVNFTTRNDGLVEWAEMLARSYLAGESVPAVTKLLHASVKPPVVDPESEPDPLELTEEEEQAMKAWREEVAREHAEKKPAPKAKAKKAKPKKAEPELSGDAFDGGWYDRPEDKPTKWVPLENAPTSRGDSHYKIPEQQFAPRGTQKKAESKPAATVEPEKPVGPRTELNTVVKKEPNTKPEPVPFGPITTKVSDPTWRERFETPPALRTDGPNQKTPPATKPAEKKGP